MDKPIRDGFEKSWEGDAHPPKYPAGWSSSRAWPWHGAVLPYVNVKPAILFVHGPKALSNWIQVPSVRISETMFKDHNDGSPIERQPIPSAE